MRLGLNFGYMAAEAKANLPLVQEADRLGFHSVWTAEAYGADAVTVATWLGAQTEHINVGTAIMQMPARTPAMTAMTAATIDLLTEGRFLMGLGLSGPQVVEGWHGQPYGRPLVRTREYVEIVRGILRREERLEHHGLHYDIPYSGEDATGLGKPLKLILHPVRNEIPVYLASLGPKNVALTAELADGWLPVFYSPYKADVFAGPLQEGFARAEKASGHPKGFEAFDIAPTVPVVLMDDVETARNLVKPMMALYIGGMGAKGRNFYNDLACRYGFEEAAARIQDLYLDGHKGEATALVPDALVDETALCGPADRIRDRIEAWKESDITTMICGSPDVNALRLLAELLG
ncbi:MAG: LLM class F420-dependent oxidoreductase [Acidimicrobiia bacterium]|nr:LLM class F420-dependent oxidoreductase [Acidimicrobiia bacterium]